MDENEIKNTAENHPESDPNEEKFAEISKNLREIMSKNNISKYVLIANNGEANITFYNSDMHYYDAAKIMADALREFKIRIAKELD